MVQRALLLWIVLGAVVVAREPAAGQTKIVLGEYKFNEPRLYSMEPGGANLEELTGVIPAADWLVVGVQVDVDAGKIYWTHGSSGQGRIRRANLDGSDLETLLSNLTNARGLALDVAGGKLYWSDTIDNRMYRANLDGSSQEIVIDLGQQLGHPTLDLVNQQLYFGVFEPFGAGEMRRANLDGTGQEVLFGDLYTPIAVALDLSGGKIYWADSNTSFVSNHIARANFDGSDMEVLYEGQPTSSGFTGIGLDLAAGKLYWSDEITNSEKGVWEANLDGSGATRIFESPTGWNAGALAVLAATSTSPSLVRGDCNADGAFDVADPITLLAVLFSGGGPPDCDDSCDANDDGAIDVADAIFDLSALFSGGPAPPPPHPGCGPDPTNDALGCGSFPSCP